MKNISRKEIKEKILFSFIQDIKLLLDHLYSLPQQLYLINLSLKKISISVKHYNQFLEENLKEEFLRFKKNSYFFKRPVKIKSAMILYPDSYLKQFNLLSFNGLLNDTMKLDLTLYDYIFFVKKYIESDYLKNKKKLVTPHQIIVPNINPIGGKSFIKKKIPGHSFNDIIESIKYNILNQIQ
ncbi:hypothetical protein AB0W31_08305 [Aliarcobacter butzleri]|uniref:hypothetical protein n=1 Tax=Aliarcobacter butzleri TaxID=28197 RepID=UPI001EDFC245|nr:hypothetical protein [Aliarcobacter butzleri]MCG3699498.1 hypothetical protein [Aliarcobacter butzleri]